MNTDFKRIPDGWRLSTVGIECLICNSLREPLAEEERRKMRGAYPYYGPTKAIDYLDHFRIQGTYALVGEDGDHFLKYEHQDMTQLVSGSFNVNNHAHIVQGGKDCSTEWFYTFFRRRCLSPFLTRQGAGRYKLTRAALEKLPILIPSKSEQMKIHSTILEWDRSIDLTERLISARQERRKWLMQQLLTGKRRLPGFNSKWQAIRVDEIFENKSVRGNGNEELLSVTQDRAVIPRSLLEARVTMPSGDTNSFKLVEPGDFLVSLRSFQGGFEYSEYRGLVSPAYTVLKNKIEITHCFFKHYFKSPTFISRLSVAVIGIRDGKQVSFRDSCSLKLPFPSTDEQRAIATIMDTADQELDLLRQQLNALREQKKGLMQQLLTGKVRVKIAEDNASTEERL